MYIAYLHTVIEGSLRCHQIRRYIWFRMVQTVRAQFFIVDGVDNSGISEGNKAIHET